MKKIISSLLCFAMIATLTACGSGSSRDTSLIRVAVGGDCAYLDPAIVDDSITSNILAQMYEGLYSLDSDGNAVAKQATDLPTISDDGLTYTITLNDGLTWSDGEAVKASDYVYAWKRASAMGPVTSYYSQFVNKIKGANTTGDALSSMDELTDFGAVAKDDKTIVITLSEKCAYFTSLLTNTVFYPVRQDIVEKDGSDPLKSTWADTTNNPTNGAFTATAINAKDEIDLEKNSGYYAADEVSIEKITFKVMSDSDTETNGFLAGELDFATNVNVETVLGDESLQESAYLIDPFVCNYYMLINAGDESTREELKDSDIRKAISLGINRDNILKAIGYGDYAYALDQFVPKGIPGATGDFNEEDTTVYASYDIDEAKKIMESKGYSSSNMLTLEYKYNDTPMHKAVAESMQASLKECYINLKLTVEEKETFFNDRDAGNFEVCRHAMTADFLDPMAYLSMYVGAVGGNTVDDEKYEALIAEAEKLDGAERMNKLHEAEEYLVKEQNYIVPLFGYTDPILKATDLDGVTSSPEGHYDLTRASYK
jgi:oligopeptide transport system substrate-binding protein